MYDVVSLTSLVFEDCPAGGGLKVSGIDIISASGWRGGPHNSVRSASVAHHRSVRNLDIIGLHEQKSSIT